MVGLAIKGGAFHRWLLNMKWVWWFSVGRVWARRQGWVAGLLE